MSDGRNRGLLGIRLCRFDIWVSDFGIRNAPEHPAYDFIVAQVSVFVKRGGSKRW